MSPSWSKKKSAPAHYQDSASKERNEIGSFVETGMDLEAVIQSEVSQKEKKQITNTYMWNLEKWYRWSYLQNRSRDTDIKTFLRFLFFFFDPWVRKIPWRRERLPTPIFLPGEFHGQRSLAGYSPWGHKELDMTKKWILYKSKEPHLVIGTEW